MKKTFRRAIACLLAVLMVVFSFPFTALAAAAENGWWGDNNFNAAKNENIPAGEQSYNGWNSADWDFGLAWGDAVTMGADLDMAAEARDMLDEYKPVLTVTVSDQGTADNRIYRQYYGYSSAFDYDTVEKAGNIMNPADLHAGDRIAVTIEIGGFDFLYSGQVKGLWDTDYLATAYYKLNPSSKDQWAKCTTAQTTQAFITRGAATYYATVATDAAAQVTDNTAGQFYIPFTGNVAAPASAYCGADQRPFGKNGMVVCTLSFEVLQDCDLSDVMWFDRDKDGSAAYACTRFVPFDWNDLGTDCCRYTFDTQDTTYTSNLIALNWSNYSAGEDKKEHEHTYDVTVVDPTCTEDGYTKHVCNNSDGLGAVGDDEYTDTPVAKLGHDYVIISDTTSSCTVAGETVYECTRCKDTYTTTKDLAAHTPASADNAVPATCTTDGKEADTICSVCGDTLETGAVIKATGHKAVSADNAVPATCTTDGKEADTICSVCGDTLETGAVIKATGHKAVSADNAVPATCTTDGKEADTICSVCGDTLETGAVIKATGHNMVMTEEKVDPTYDAPGKEAVYTCANGCGTVTGGETIAPLKGIQVTVKTSDLGTSTLNDKAVATEDVTISVANNSQITLTATPNEGAEFVGWNVNGKLVSTEANYTFTALANITVEPVFQMAGDTFTVVFTDKWGNVISTQTVASGADIVIPAVPEVAGYTTAGWSMTDDAIKALTEAATINAKYDRVVENTCKVTANGATIATPYESAENELANIGYNTLVTVTAPGATAWKLDGTTVAYGESYSFYIGSDVVIEPVFDAVDATPTVAAVSVTETGTGTNRVGAQFLATRSMADGYTFVNAGYVYGKDLADDNITLADVDGTTVKAAYVATASEQFALSWGIAAQTGKITARAFIAFVDDATGTTQVVYADPQTYTYA